MSRHGAAGALAAQRIVQHRHRLGVFDAAGRAPGGWRLEPQQGAVPNSSSDTPEPAPALSARDISVSSVMHQPADQAVPPTLAPWKRCTPVLTAYPTPLHRTRRWQHASLLGPPARGQPALLSTSVAERARTNLLYISWTMILMTCSTRVGKRLPNWSHILWIPAWSEACSASCKQTLAMRALQ